MKRSWWDFHTPGDEDCEACATSPTPHVLTFSNFTEECGLIHTQFAIDFAETEAKCDQCGLLLPMLAVG